VVLALLRDAVPAAAPLDLVSLGPDVDAIMGSDRHETLYDLVKRGEHELDYQVIPGISSIQALAAKHKTTLNRIGQSIEITTGRKIAEGFPNNVDSVVVMLVPYVLDFVESL
jgi:precorrin-2 methylase